LHDPILQAAHGHPGGRAATPLAGTASLDRLGLVLYGGTGTAIAFRLEHRPSVDFDFFTAKPLDKAVLQSAFP